MEKRSEYLAHAEIPLSELITLLEPLNKSELSGDFASKKISGVGPIESATEHQVAFLAAREFLPAFSACKAGVVVVSEALWTLVPEAAAKNKICLRMKDPMIGMALLSQKFSQEPKSWDRGVHSTAVIHPSAKISATATIGPRTTVAAGAVIGENVVLHPGVSVGEGASIGRGSVLFPNVVIYPSCVIGEDTRIHACAVIGADGFGYAQKFSGSGASTKMEHIKIQHVGRVRIGNRVEIGANTCIDRGTLDDTVIGDGCKIDNQVQIGHNCNLEEGVIVCGNTGFAGSVKVGKYAFVAGMVGVTNKAHIGSGAKVAAFSGVYGDIPAGQTWGGHPARPLGEFHRMQVMLKRLPELFRKEKKARKEEV